jgi:hypothetical protein
MACNDANKLLSKSVPASLTCCIAVLTSSFAEPSWFCVKSEARLFKNDFNFWIRSTSLARKIKSLASFDSLAAMISVRFITFASKKSFFASNTSNWAVKSAVFVNTSEIDWASAWHCRSNVMLPFNTPPLMPLPKQIVSMELKLNPKLVLPIRSGKVPGPQKDWQTSSKPSTSIISLPAGGGNRLQKSVLVFCQNATFMSGCIDEIVGWHDVCEAMILSEPSDSRLDIRRFKLGAEALAHALPARSHSG